MGTHLKGPVTVLLVLVGHRVRGRQEESAGGGRAQVGKCDGGDEKRL